MRATVALGLVVALVACKQDGTTQPCMNMTGQSQLVDAAATLRVAVYDGSVPCSGVGAATPIVVRDFAKGAAIEMDVKAGSRTIVLTALDASGVAIGQACTTANLGKGSNLCFDLVVEPVTPPDLLGQDLSAKTDGGTDGGDVDLAVASDGGTEPDLSDAEDLLPAQDLTPVIDLTPVDLVPPPDLKPQCTPGTVGVDCPPSSLCCGNLCVANNTATNCGACGQGCNPANGTATCATGTCVVACNPGFDNCDDDGSDGCEVNLNEDPNHCGGCTRACSTTQTNVLDCTSGTCNSTCNAGFGNCTQPLATSADNGCETDLTVATNNCGGCGNTCGTQFNSARSCGDPGICSYTCNGTRQDCNGATAPNLDGCECEGTACCSGACQGKHNTGLGNMGNGHTFYNCTARDAYSLSLATDACNEYKAQNGITTANCFADTCGVDANEGLVCLLTSSRCACWYYASANSDLRGRAYVNFDNSNPQCFCPDSNDTQWH